MLIDMGRASANSFRVLRSLGFFISTVVRRSIDEILEVKELKKVATRGGGRGKDLTVSLILRFWLSRRVIACRLLLKVLRELRGCGLLSQRCPY